MNSYMDYLSSYNDFLITEMTMQSHMMDCVEEAVCIAEGTTYVHEGVITNKLKELWNKFVQFINKIFAKFKEAFNRVDPKGYLEKYAGIITKQPIKFTDLSMVNYDLDAMSKAHAENFDPAKIDVYKAGNAAYLKTIQPFTGYNGSDENESINNYIKVALCGGKTADEVDINPKTLNMTDLYTYCHDFKDKTQPALEKDQNAIISSSNTFEKLLKEIDTAERQAARDAQQIKEDEIKTTPETGAESYINLNTSFKTLSELTIGNNNKVNDANGGAPAVDANTKFSKNAAGLTGQEANKDTVKTASGYSDEDIKKAIDTYKTVNGAICNIKLTLCTQAYKDYMQIIKTHVRSYVGEKQTTPATAQSGTDYSKNNPAAQQAQDKAAAADAAVGGGT